MTTRGTQAGDAKTELWPALPLEAWQASFDTLHMWTQVVGKVKVRLCPPLNEWWHVAFHVSPRGLRTGSIPYGDGIFEVEFDFVDHNLRIVKSDGGFKALPLMLRSVADFYQEFMAALRSLGIEVSIKTTPDEVAEAIPFEQDREHASYDAAPVERWWRIMVQTSKVLDKYRSSFAGKSSPVHFFWGGFDLAHTRFSGRRSDPPPEGSRLYRLSEDQENISCGFWLGDSRLPEPAFYSYTYPKPDGFEAVRVRPDAAHWEAGVGNFVLLYDDARKSPSPEAAILEFFQSTYEAGATLGKWDRAWLEQGTRI